ncbi:D-xylose proton-symporter XylT [Lactococcus lactis subsp. lactis]|uniref:MFS transporter, sugar porter (SP) family n=2 Tax=Lactococcus lactis TaxID=1358 RepID=A0A2A5SDN6_LACLH|nr:D-xylose proton-symporter XylT [Lactococcus lactis subsp. lactis]PCS11573.1 MFS transporter, sugar porter (SP) family [Lactococcus lactis subsp. hordniae]
MIMTGILLAYISNYALKGVSGNWHWMLGLATVPAALLFIGGLFLPESPRFLVRHDNEAVAREILGMINDDPNSIEAEISDIQLIAKKEKQGGLQELFGQMSRPVLIMAIGLAIFQQVMGCNTVLYFAPSIFVAVGFGASAALLAHIGIGIFNVIVTYIAMRVMDKVNRRWMLNFGAWGMGISLVLMSLGMILAENAHIGFGKYLAVIALTVYIAFFSATWGPVMWVMIGESFPLKIRGLGNSFGAAVNWAANWVVSLTFLPLLSFFGTGKIFLIYAACCFLSIWFTSKKVIETRGKTLEQIEAELLHRVHHLEEE